LKVLVTGGAGFIGTNLVHLLCSQGHSVRVLDNLSVGRRDDIEYLATEIIVGDVLNPDQVDQAASGMDGVVHLAAQTGVPGSLLDPHRDCQVNVLGTLNVLEACRHQAVRRLVFASSNAPLGRQPPPATEDKAPLPISPYGASKLAGEGYCLAYYGSWGLGTIVLRFANVYGPYSAHKGSVVAKFFKDIQTTGQITIDGDGQQTRDFIYVGDLCRAISLALQSEMGGEVFQIATGIETSILELAELVQTTMQKQINTQHSPFRQGDIRKNYSEIGKATRLLQWVPQVALADGLQQTWQWFVDRDS
jgi:UDP-glucose 4-epimerase